MRLIITLVFLSFGATSAHAAEPWPANVCKELADWEREKTEEWKGVLWLRALSRDVLLSMQRAHCGVDNWEKQRTDAGLIADGLDQLIKPGQRPTNCTIIKLENGLSTMSCP